jgi:hypothetical protein
MDITVEKIDKKKKLKNKKDREEKIKNYFMKCCSFFLFFSL